MFYLFVLHITDSEFFLTENWGFEPIVIIITNYVANSNVVRQTDFFTDTDEFATTETKFQSNKHK